LKPGPGKDAVDVARNQRARIHRAMIELVKERGFDAITVRELAARAGVSTRTFYQCYSGKEDCFLRVHELIVRRLLCDLSGAQSEDDEPHAGLERTIMALLGGWHNDPAAARLLLVDSQTVGPGAGAQVQRGLRSIERRIGESLEGVDRASPSPLISGSLTAGLFGLAASRLLVDPDYPLGDLTYGLSSWARALDDVPSLNRLEKLGMSASSLVEQFRPPVPSSEGLGARGDDLDGDISLLLSSVAKLIAGSDHEPSSTKALLRAAGVSRRSFQERFAGLEDCVLTAIRLRGEAAVAHAELAGLGGVDPATRVVRAVVSLCIEVAADPDLASLCFGRRAFESVAKLRCQDRVRNQFADLIGTAIGVAPPPAGLQVEASAAAVWGVLRGQVIRGRSSAVSHLAPFLSYVVLAPSFGAPAALETVQHEYALAKRELIPATRSSNEALKVRKDA